MTCRIRWVAGSLKALKIIANPTRKKHCKPYEMYSNKLKKCGETLQIWRNIYLKRFFNCPPNPVADNYLFKRPYGRCRRPERLITPMKWSRPMKWNRRPGDCAVVEYSEQQQTNPSKTKIFAQRRCNTCLGELARKEKRDMAESFKQTTAYAKKDGQQWDE